MFLRGNCSVYAESRRFLSFSFLSIKRDVAGVVDDQDVAGKVDGLPEKGSQRPSENEQGIPQPGIASAILVLASP